MRRSPIPLLLAALLLLFTSCLPNGNRHASSLNSAGFWLGLWHGIIAPLTFALSLFWSTIGMYEVQNTGGWYNLGFLIGLGMLHGGGAAGRHSRRRWGRRKGD